MEGVTMDNIQIEQGQGNVFADLGLDNADELLVKAELARKINKILEELHLYQLQAAQLLWVDQPKISALMNSKLSGYSIERLFRFLTILGQDVRIAVKTKSPRSKQGQVKIIAV
jgi:predicted XRE-type DNA-binding protein